MKRAMRGATVSAQREGNGQIRCGIGGPDDRVARSAQIAAPHSSVSVAVHNGMRDQQHD
jgi:hypothetical protein